MYGCRHWVPSRKETLKPPLSDSVRIARSNRLAACIGLRYEGMSMNLSGDDLARFVKKHVDALTGKISAATKSCAGKPAIKDLYCRRDVRFTN